MTTVIRTLLYILFHMPIWKQSRVTGCSVNSALDTKRQLERGAFLSPSTSSQNMSYVVFC